MPKRRRSPPCAPYPPPPRSRGAEWWRWYDGYLHSDEWRAKRRRVLRRAGGICERCGRAKAAHVHHLTYARVGRERIEDLVGLCWPCHQAQHAKPTKEKP